MLLLIALLSAVPVASAETMPQYLEGYSCDRFVRDIERSASGSGKGGTDAGADALRWALARCPEDERVWYLLARYSEADAIPERDRLFPDAQTAIEAAFKKFPTSRIATVRARVEGTIEAAQSAVQIDPSYQPARIAQAGAMLRASQTSDALDILEPMAKDSSDKKVGLQHSFTGWLTLARARLAADDPRGAEQAFRRAGRLDLDDTYLSLVPPARRYESFLVDGLVAVGLEDYRRAAHQLLLAAARGSREAIDELQQGSPPLRRRVVAIVDPFEGAIELPKGVSEPAGLRKRERELGPIALGIAAWVARDYREGASYFLKGLTGTPEEQGYIISLIREHDELACALREEVAGNTLPSTEKEVGQRVLEQNMCPDYADANADWAMKHPCDSLVREIKRAAEGAGERDTNSGSRELRSALARCPDDERVWYLLARYSEADKIPAEYRQFPDAATATDAAFKKFPTPPIATVRARVLGSIEAAQIAVQIEPSYRPARIALARALLRAGRTNEALELLEPMAKDPDDEKVGLQYSFTGWITLARARLTAGDPRGAAKAVRNSGSSELDDGYSSLNPRWKHSESWTVRGLVSLALKEYPQAAHMLLIAAARGSTEALAELQRAAPPLRNQVVAIVHGPTTLSMKEGGNTRSVALGIGKWLLGDYEGAVRQLLAGIDGGGFHREYITSLIVDHDELVSALRAGLAAKHFPPALMEDARTVLSGHKPDERGDD